MQFFNAGMSCTGCGFGADLNAITRGTTPTHIFDTSISLEGVEACYITYKQQQQLVLEKDIADIAITSRDITVRLSQKDTLAFRADVPVEVQIRAKFPTGAAVASNIMIAGVGRILKDGEI